MLAKVTMTAALLGAFLVSGAGAATIATGGTGSTGAGGFEITAASNGVTEIFDTGHWSYFQGETSPASGWVWNATSGLPSFSSLTFQFAFSLAAYDLDTVSLSGLWGIDNVGSVFLNGTQISSLPDVVASNFTELHAFGASGPGLFQQGDNFLTFEVADEGGTAGFRASVSVTGELAPVPLPASLPLVLAGLAAFGAIGVRRARRAYSEA